MHREVLEKSTPKLLFHQNIGLLTYSTILSRDAVSEGGLGWAGSVGPWGLILFSVNSWEVPHLSGPHLWNVD